MARSIVAVIKYSELHVGRQRLSRQFHLILKMKAAIEFVTNNFGDNCYKNEMVVKVVNIDKLNAVSERREDSYMWKIRKT